jgi:ribonucleotide reductase beta subunit family protein with ferritin-like domain
MFKEYLRFVANRRAQQIGLDQLFPGATNPFPWMSELIDLKKEKNFFETRVIEYQTGGALSWDLSWAIETVKTRSPSRRHVEASCFVCAT